MHVLVVGLSIGGGGGTEVGEGKDKKGTGGYTVGGGFGEETPCLYT